MTRLKWLWWKFWAWLTTPWRPEDVVGNPRAKKRRGDPAWMVFATQMMYFVNAAMLAVVIVSLLGLIALSIQ